MPRSASVSSMQLSLFEETPPTVDVAVGPTRGAPPLAPPAAAPAAAALPPPSQPSSAPAALADLLAPAHFRHPRGNREVLLQGHRVGYEFRRAKRKTIGFVVGPEGLVVSAPRWVPLSEVDVGLKEKAGWILRKLQEQGERARRLAAARIEWRDGASFPFLGETVILVLDTRATGAMLNTDAQALPGVPRLTLHVGLPEHASAEQIRDAVQSWLQRQAKRIFEERCAHFAAQLGVRVTRLGLSSASTRWGSASADGAIRLHWRLVHFAMPIVDYVVAHELAHLREMNHSAAFWEVVRSVVPGYEASREALKDEHLVAFE
jgi:predicted metal-dependent hydrolase